MDTWVLRIFRCSEMLLKGPAEQGQALRVEGIIDKEIHKLAVGIKLPAHLPGEHAQRTCRRDPTAGDLAVPISGTVSGSDETNSAEEEPRSAAAIAIPAQQPSVSAYNVLNVRLFFGGFANHPSEHPNSGRKSRYATHRW